MLSSRIVVAGAVVMVSMVIGGPVRGGCDSSSLLTCVGSDHAAEAKGDAASAHHRHGIKRPARSAKSFDRSRRHADAHKARHVRMARERRPRTAPAVQASHVPVSASARRFREFVNPRSIAENLVDELKRPRPDASDLTTSTTFLTVAARLQPPIGAAPEDTPFFQEETSELDLAPGGDARPIKVDLAAE